MEDIVYFLIPKFKELNVKEDYKKLVSWLGGQDLELVQESEIRHKIIYKDRPHTAFLELNMPNESQDADTGKITLRISHGDAYSLRNIKEFTRTAGYKIYSLELNSFVPESSYIRDLKTLVILPELLKVFAAYEFEPLFIEEVPNQSNIFYARKKGGNQIHIINPYLLEYYMNWGGVTAKSSEFSYEVAEDINKFTLYANRGLLPFSFYNKFGNDIKIYNDSGIDVNNPGRKVFIKPIVLQIDNENFQFYTKQGERGAMILMDKIREGETLDESLNRILKEWGLSEGYLRAFVARNVEFDKDKADLLIPRIMVYVYVEKLLKMPEGSQRNWDPIKS